MGATPPFRLYLITDRRQVPARLTLSEAVERALEGGVDAVQLREKDLSAAQLLPLARELRSLTLEFGAKFLVNDRVDVALAVGADGVHLGGHSLPPEAVRELVGPERFIGVSTHSREEVARAGGGGADFVTFGPVYATPSKLCYGPPVGLEALREACAATDLPVYALGGVVAGRVGELRAAGAAGVAAISAVLAAEDPRQGAASLLAGDATF